MISLQLTPSQLTGCVSGSIPATGRKDARTTGAGSAGATGASAAAAAAMLDKPWLHHQPAGATAASAAVQPVVSAPTSLQFNQLIGGAVSPNVLAAAAAPQPAAAAAATNLVIGDYVQSNLGYVLNSNASAAANVLRQ